MILCCEKFDTLHGKAVNTLHQRFSRNIIFTATTLDLKHILSINDTAIPDPQPLWGADFMFSVAHLLPAVKSSDKFAKEKTLPVKNEKGHYIQCYTV